MPAFFFALAQWIHGSNLFCSLYAATYPTLYVPPGTHLSGIDFALQPGARLRGRVIFEGSGTPAAGYAVVPITENQQDCDLSSGTLLTPPAGGLIDDLLITVPQPNWLLRDGFEFLEMGRQPSVWASAR